MRKIVLGTFVLAIVTCLTVAYFITASMSIAFPLNSKAHFQISDTGDLDNNQAIATIQQAAITFNANIFKDEPNPSDSFQSRHFFAFIGDTPLFKQQGEYEHIFFERGNSRSLVFPASDLADHDIRGNYATTLAKSDVPQVVDFLQEHTITANVVTSHPLIVVLLTLGERNFVGIAVIVFIALILVIAYTVSEHRKQYAIESIHGYSKRSIVINELRSMSELYWKIALASLVVFFPVVWLLHGFAEIILVSTIVIAVLLFLYVFIIFSTVVAIQLLGYGHIPSIIKGQRGVIKLAVYAGIVQILVIGLAVVSVHAGLSKTSAIAQSIHDVSYWEQNQDLYALRLSISSNHHDDMAIAPAFAQIVTDLEQTNEVLLAKHEHESTIQNRMPTGQYSLIVNNTYLQRQPVKDSNKKVVLPKSPEPGHFRLLIPMSYQGNIDDLAAKYQQHFTPSSCASLQTDDSTADQQNLVECQPTVEIVRTASNQKLATFGQTAHFPLDFQGPALLTDPVIAVVSAASGLVEPVYYVSYASSDDLFFVDGKQTAQLLAEHGIRYHFQGIDNAAASVEEAIAMTQRRLQMDIATILFGLAIAIAASAILAVVYCHVQFKPMFVRLIHGCSFLVRHYKYLIPMLFLTSGTVLGATMLNPNPEMPTNIVVGVLFVAAQMIIATVAVGVYETRLRAYSIKQGG